MADNFFKKQQHSHIRRFGKDSRGCRITGVKQGVIRKYGLNICRRAFREHAEHIGFKKVSIFSFSCPFLLPAPRRWKRDLRSTWISNLDRKSNSRLVQIMNLTFRNFLSRNSLTELNLSSDCQFPVRVLRFCRQRSNLAKFAQKWKSLVYLDFAQVSNRYRPY